MYESIKKVRYSQLFSGFQNIKGKVEGYEELQNAQNFDQAQVVQDVIDYLDYDLHNKERQFRLHQIMKLRMSPGLEQDGGKSFMAGAETTT